jgi:hypothetical protein
MSPDDAKSAFSALYLGQQGINSVGIQLPSDGRFIIVVGAEKPSEVTIPTSYEGYEVRVVASPFIAKQKPSN